MNITVLLPGTGWLAVALEPARDVVGVEADEVAPFDVGDALLVDEATDVARLDAEVLGERRDVEQLGDVVEMLDTKGGHKGLDSAALRDTVEAATMVGRLHSAARAVELGFAIEADPGPSGNLRHWRIAGIPHEVCELYSKRADEIDAYLTDAGYTGYRARGVAARDTRTAKHHTGADELLPHWQHELGAIGWSVERLADALDHARTAVPRLPLGMTSQEIDALTADVFDVEGPLMRQHKVFTAPG